MSTHQVSNQPEEITVAHDKAQARFGAESQDPSEPGHGSGAADSGITLHEERLRGATEKVRSKAVRLRVKVVTEEQTVTVPLRREVLEIIELDDDPDSLDGVGGLRKPREITLHEERVAVETVAYEKVRITRQKVRDEVAVEAEVAREVLEIDGDTATRHA